MHLLEDSQKRQVRTMPVLVCHLNCNVINLCPGLFVLPLQSLITSINKMKLSHTYLSTGIIDTSHYPCTGI